MRKGWGIAASVALLALALPGVGAHGLPVAYRDGVEGSGSWGLRVDLATPSGLHFALRANDASTGSIVGVGILRLDASGAVIGGYQTYRQFGPDRLRVETMGGGEAAPMDVRVTQGTGAGGDCALLCVGLEVRLEPAGTSRWVAWIAGASRADITVEAGGAAVEAARGPAWALSDAELHGGTANVQAQHTVPLALGQEARVGAKAMAGNEARITAPQALYGSWQVLDPRLACAVVLVPATPNHSGCVRLGEVRGGVEETCRAELGAGCSTAQISWEGPAGQVSGRWRYDFQAAAAGDYTFREDMNVDAYGPEAYNGFPLYSGLLAWEPTAFLNAASVDVPG